jgi:mRNA-degrading endonuclease RelE of RelBE toxin-antitoxin system
MQVILSKEARKQCSKLPKPEKAKVKRRLKILESYPLLGKKLKGEYKGLRVLKSWPYRVFYLIKKTQKEVWVVTISHCQDAYN